MLINRGAWVQIVEEGETETIDGLSSAWVKVRLQDNTEGWCFGGYLGF
jgi:hypothetical protein